MNKLLTKIVGVVLGTTMAVGVGVGVAVNNNRNVVDSQVEAAAGDSPIILDATNLGLSSTATSSSGDEKTYGGKKYIVAKGKSQTIQSTATKYFQKTNAILLGKKGAFLYNDEALPGAITKFEIYSNKNSSTSVEVGVKFSSNKISTAPSSWDYDQVLNTDDKQYDLGTIPSGSTYFRYQVLSDHNSQVQFKITYSAGVSRTVTYQPGTGATGTIPNSTGSSINLKTWDDISGLVQAPSGKVFVGWNVAENGSGTYYKPGQTVTEDLNLYAQWMTPYTVSSARTAIDSGSEITNVAAKGIVSEITTAYNSTYKNISFNLSDDGTRTSSQLLAYRCSSASDPDIKVGDVVALFGTLKKYESTYEFDSGNTIVGHSKITGLSVTTAPKTTYLSGDEFEADNLVVSASYDNGESNHTFSYENHAANFELTPDDGVVLTTSVVSVSIKYGHGSTTQAITVNPAPAVLSVSVSPTSKVIGFDEEFTITASVSVEGGASESVSWAVLESSTLVTIKESDTSSATIKANSSNTGTVVVRATSLADNTKKADCTIKVVDPDVLVDTLTYSLIGVTGTSYTSWSGISDATSAIYKGTTSGGNSSIQMNNSSAYIVNTASAGYVRKIDITFESHTSSTRTLSVYGSSSAFESRSDISNGTFLGSVEYDGVNASYTINVAAIYEYQYFGIIAGGGALYLDEIVITYDKIDTTPSILIIGNNSITGKESGSDSTSTKIKVRNIESPSFSYTFDEDGKTAQASSNHVSVSEGTPTDGIYPLTFNFTNAGTTKVHVTVSALSVEIDVTVVEVSYISATLSAQYRQVFNESSLQAGDQIIIADNNSDNTKDKVMNTTSGNYFGASAVTFTNSYVTTANATSANSLVVTLGGTSGAWTLTYGSSKYLSANSSSNFVEGTSSDTWTIDIEDGDATITYKTSSYGRILHNVSSTRYKPYPSGTSVSSTMRLPQIYKLVSGEKQVEVDSDLLSAISSAENTFTCDSDGASFDVTNFNAMSSYFSNEIINKYYLDFAESKDALSGGTVVENFLARYDYVMMKKLSGNESYASANDFLGRVSSGKVHTANNSVLNANHINTTHIAIIVVISVVSMVSIAGYFLLRKRKEER